MKKLHSWWRRRGGFLYFAGQSVKLVVLEELDNVAAHTEGCTRRIQLSLRPVKPFKSCRLFLFLFCFFKHETRLFTVGKKNVGKVVTLFRRGGRTSSRKESVDFGGGCCGRPGSVRFVLLGRRSVLSRSLRPLLCSRQVSKTKKSLSN